MEGTKIVIGTATITENPLTGNWFIYGQKGEENTPYIMEDKNTAIRLGKTVDHYNKTGERKKFSLKEARLSIDSETYGPIP